MRRKIPGRSSRGKVQKIYNKGKITHNVETQLKINEEIKGKFHARPIERDQNCEDKIWEFQNDTISDWLEKFPHYNSVVTDNEVDLVPILDPLKDELEKILIYLVKKQEILQEESSTSSDTKKSKLKKLNQASEVADNSVMPEEAFITDFWKFMEMYFGEFSAENLNKFKASINACDADFLSETMQPLDSDVDKITEDKGQIKKNEVKCMDESGSSQNSSRGASLLNGDSISLGPLTQRLISCFYEENHRNQGKDIVTSVKDSAHMHTPVKPEFMNSLQLSSLFGSPEELENQIRKKLLKYGILENKPRPPEDKVLAKLKELQTELKSVHAKNINQKKALLNLAEKEMAKQQILKKMQYSESEVVAAFKEIAKFGIKREMTDRERRHVKKILENHNVGKILEEHKKITEELNVTEKYIAS